MVRRYKKKLPRFLPPRIAFLSIGEICYRILGRGGAVGAGRELPAHPVCRPSGIASVCSGVACCAIKETRHPAALSNGQWGGAEDFRSHFMEICVRIITFAA